MKRKAQTKPPTPAEVANKVSEGINNTITDMRKLPKPIKVATVHALRDKEFSIRKIASITGIDKDTVCDYLSDTIDDKWLLYRDAVNKIFTERNDRLKSLTANAIEKKLEDVSKVQLFQLSGLYKVLHDVEGSKSNSHNSQPIMTVVNVHPALSRENYRTDKVIDVDPNDIDAK